MANAAMIRHVARKELTEIVRDGRFVWTAAIIGVLLLATLVAGAARYAQESALRAQATAEVRSQWLGQGEKGPHSAAHYGVYAFKPATPLALFDPGVNDYTGTIQFLEAHKENQAGYKPAQDATALQRFGDLSGAMVMQLLIPLLIIFLCFSMICGEREEGSLRQLLSAGARNSDLVWGKAFGAFLALASVIVPVGIIGAAMAAWFIRDTNAHEMIDFPARVLVLSIAYIAYFTVFVAISLGVSIAARSSRASLTILLGFWIVSCLLLPRAAADISRRACAAPSALELATAIERGRDAGPHPHEPNHPNHIAWRTKLLADHHVSRIEDLPFGFVGYGLQVDEEHGYKVFDEHYGALWRTYEVQNRLQQWAGILSPPIAMQTLSAALSGTDLDLFHDFAASAERYRRNMIRLLNTDIMRQTVGKDMYYGEWEYRSGAELWRTIPPFDYDVPRLSQVLEKNLLSIGVLVLWLLGSIAVLVRSTRALHLNP